MKIGILTQPLKVNYGGLLQAYALKEVLELLDHEVVIINRQAKPSKVRVVASIVKSAILRKPINPIVRLSNKEKRIISNQTSLFRQKYIPNLTDLITNDKGMLELNRMGFNAYIVGSDQCWRPKYSSKITNYFLDFAEKQRDIKRIAYAASFGVSDWEFNKKDTKKCSDLVKKFDAISTREESGVDLIKRYLGTDAVHLIDPTMLLSINDYLKIAIGEEPSEGSLKVYILDKTQDKQTIVDLVEQRLGVKRFEVLPKKRLDWKRIGNINDFVYPNPAKWLRGYQDAKFVVTDSFHGTVFSILFNVPFFVIGNKRRGMARFESLLKMFGLEDRLIHKIDDLDLDPLIKKDIDWDSVNLKLKNEREKAMSFLKSNLQ